MDKTNNSATTATTKTTAFNLIILDESGSMCGLTKQTIDGCNETLNVVRALQKKYGDTTRQLVSVYAFQSGTIPSRYICKNAPADSVNNITTKDYRPEGCTPLLDAVGMTLVDLKAVASTHEDATASVTIITDGYENSSREFSWKQVSDLIAELKEDGWNFNFIGANIDVEAVSKKMNIDNALAFTSDPAGTQQMWDTYSESLQNYEEDRICCEAIEPEMSREEKVMMRKSKSGSFFRR